PARPAGARAADRPLTRGSADRGANHRPLAGGSDADPSRPLDRARIRWFPGAGGVSALIAARRSPAPTRRSRFSKIIRPARWVGEDRGGASFFEAPTTRTA